MKPFGIVRRIIVGIIAAAFLGLGAVFCLPALSGRAEPGSDDFVAALVMGGLLLLVGVILAWVTWDMGRKARRQASLADVATAAMPHLMNLDMDGGDTD